MRLLLLLGLLTAVLAATATGADAPAVAPVGTLSAPARGVTAGPDGALWFTTRTTVGTVRADGTTTEHPVAGADAGAITPGPDGALWFIAARRRLARAATDGTVTVLPDLQAEPHALAAGPDGAVWFAAKDVRSGSTGRAVGRVSSGGTVTLYGKGLSAEPWDITRGPGGLWVTEPEAKRVARVTTSGDVKEVPVPAKPRSIAAGADGNLWATLDGDRIARVTPTGAVSTFAAAGKPGDITAGPDDALWFAREHGFGRISPAGDVSIWDLTGADPGAITSGGGAVTLTDAKVRFLRRVGVRTSSGTTPDPSSPSDPSDPSTAVHVAVPTPTLDGTVVAEPARGRVRVRTPGGRFRVLDGLAGVPVGSVFDTRRGTLELRSATPRGVQRGRFRGGVFAVGQGRAGRTDLRLRGRLDCRRHTVAGTSRRRPRKRRLWGRDHGGRYSTHGRDSVTTVRGTRWLVQDTCRGTLTRVTQGVVVVRDRATGRRHVVRAGERHFARHRR